MGGGGGGSELIDDHVHFDMYHRLDFGHQF